MLILVEPIGERPLESQDLPIDFGGAGAFVLLPGARAGEVLARLHLEAGRWLLRGPGIAPPGAVALDGGGWVDCGTARLRLDVGGAVPRLLVEHAAIPNSTVPPLVDQQLLEVAVPTADRVPFAPVAYAPPRAMRVARARRWHPARWLAAGTVVGLVAVVGFLVAATPVTVETLPQVRPDVVEFAGTADLHLGGRHLVWPAHSQLRVLAKGFRPATVEVTIERGGGQTVRVPLERLPGRVRFDTAGVQAALTVDGKRLGEVPGVHELAAGTREILVEAPRYAAFHAQLVVRGGGEAQDFRIALEPAFAGLTVESVPAGARVSVDGRELGATPLATQLDAGRYTLTIVHPEHRAWTAPITIRAGQPLKIGPIELGLPDGVLMVRTEPAGADIRVSGRYVGRSPLEVTLAPGVEHEIVASRAGFSEIARAVQVAPRERRSLALRLDAVFGEVQVRGTPADADLFVDGESRGRAAQTLRLPAAPHVIEVRRAGLETFRRTVTPRPGLPQVVEFALTTAEQAKVARFAAVVRTSLGQELRLVRGGRYTLGSPRREPGRSSNESQRQVELRRPFYLGVTEVTNREYREFRPEHMSGAFKQETLDVDRQPVASVSWQDAAEFCNWLSARDRLPPAYVMKGGKLVLASPINTGYRLPTEAEWEFAARYDGNEATRKYPWGSELPVAPRSGNYGDKSAVYLGTAVLEGYDDGFRVSAPVGSFAPNPLGLVDLGGNVAEWTNDLYTLYVVSPEQVTVDPVGPDDGDLHVVRGASWLTGKVAQLRNAWREAGANGRPDLGFRIARYAE